MKTRTVRRAEEIRDARLDALGETYDVAFEFKRGAPPTLTAFGEEEDDVKTVDVGSWTADVIEEYVRSTLTPRATSPPTPPNEKSAKDDIDDEL